ncbi:hypothetical protein ABT329_41215, partial [Streptomyces minutiscleroticus]
VRCRTELNRAAPEVARATAAWQRLTDESQVATRGQELLHMWERLSEEGLLLEPSHQAMAQAVRSRLAQGVQPVPPAPSVTPAVTADQAPVAPEDKPLKPTRRGLRRFTRWPGRSAGASP